MKRQSWTLQSLALAAVSMAILGCGPATKSTKRVEHPTAARPALPDPVQGWAKVYKGPEGLKVAMVRLQDDTYLVRVTGTTSPLDGKVLRCEYQQDGPYRTSWLYQYDGRKIPLIVRRSRRGRTSMKVWLLGNTPLNGSLIQFSEQDSQHLDVAAMVKAHMDQRAKGILAKMARFDKQRNIQEVEAALAKRVKEMNAACHSQIRFHVDWKSAQPITPKNVGITSECGIALSGLANLCHARGVPEVVGPNLTNMECRIGPKPSFILRGKTLIWTVPRHHHYRIGQERARLANRVRWPNGKNLAQVIYDHRIALWTNGKGLYFGLRPIRPRDRLTASLYRKRQIFYGTKKMGMRLVHKARLGRNWFFDPRYPTEERMHRFRNTNLAYYISFHNNGDREPLSFQCGYRRVRLQPVSHKETMSVLENVKWLPPLARRQPYGLARDRRGTYYYVDRAPGPEKRDFRLYRGRLGKLQRLQMTNLVTDSEGDVFSTPNGKLRLVLEKEHSYWIRKGRKERLINVPINKNLDLIYTTLGVYEGQPFGTPCDIF